MNSWTPGAIMDDSGLEFGKNLDFSQFLEANLPIFGSFLTLNFQKWWRKSPRWFEIFQKSIKILKTCSKVFPNEFLDPWRHYGRLRLDISKKSWFSGFSSFFWIPSSPILAHFLTFNFQKLCWKSPKRFEIFEKNLGFFQTPSKLSGHTFWTP